MNKDKNKIKKEIKKKTQLFFNRQFKNFVNKYVPSNQNHLTSDLQPQCYLFPHNPSTDHLSALEGGQKPNKFLKQIRRNGEEL